MPGTEARALMMGTEMKESPSTGTWLSRPWECYWDSSTPRQQSQEPSPAQELVKRQIYPLQSGAQHLGAGNVQDKGHEGGCLSPQQLKWGVDKF